MLGRIRQISKNFTTTKRALLICNQHFQSEKTGNESHLKKPDLKATEDRERLTVDMTKYINFKTRNSTFNLYEPVNPNLAEILKTPIGKDSDYFFPDEGYITLSDIANHKIWLDYDCDLAAINFGNVFNVHCNPVMADGVNGKVIAMFYCATVIYDNAMQSRKKIDCNATKVCGKVMDDWFKETFLPGCTVPNQEEMVQVMSECLKTMAATHIQRREEGLKLVSRIYMDSDFETYFRFRNRDGCFGGTMFACILAHGGDFTTVDPEILWAGAKAALISWDLHGHYRHSTEDEFADTVRYMSWKLGVSPHSAMTVLLDYLKTLINFITRSTQVPKEVRAGIIDFAKGCATAQYHASRFKNGTGIHPGEGFEGKRMQVLEDLKGIWAHVPYADGTQVPQFKDLEKKRGAK